MLARFGLAIEADALSLLDGCGNHEKMGMDIRS